MTNDWFWTRRREAPRTRLVCLPHAGGGTGVFQPWANELPADVELWAARLPGRESRHREAPFTDAGAIVAALANAVAAAPPPGSLAIFGHSMGALLGFELAHELAGRGIVTDVLIVSGRAAPHRHDARTEIHRLPDGPFVAQLLERYGGIPREVLDDRELMQIFLPLLRADLQVVETYRYRDRSVAGWPLMVYGGTDDHSVSREALLEWQQYTHGPFRLQMIEGGHFFLQTNRAAFLEAIMSDVRTWCGARGRAGGAIRP